jgi:hypothetical protein
MNRLVVREVIHYFECFSYYSKSNYNARNEVD